MRLLVPRCNGSRMGSDPRRGEFPGKRGLHRPAVEIRIAPSQTSRNSHQTVFNLPSVGSQTNPSSDHRMRRNPEAQRLCGATDTPANEPPQKLNDQPRKCMPNVTSVPRYRPMLTKYTRDTVFSRCVNYPPGSLCFGCCVPRTWARRMNSESLLRGNDWAGIDCGPSRPAKDEQSTHSRMNGSANSSILWLNPMSFSHTKHSSDHNRASIGPALPGMSRFPQDPPDDAIQGPPVGQLGPPTLQSILIPEPFPPFRVHVGLSWWGLRQGGRGRGGSPGPTMGLASFPGLVDFSSQPQPGPATKGEEKRARKKKEKNGCGGHARWTTWGRACSILCPAFTKTNHPGCLLAAVKTRVRWIRAVVDLRHLSQAGWSPRSAK